ncbi:helix-turn-helix domain protein [Desulfocucumis palustris]|uniref:Helix-turn-helix domain protein n=1 Tax=Desulfocucumis palustris TaxID=1898651 RepID=A0A2L2XAG3_9FIRM|nr:helix-turn-helix domain-containing protein [Desulfocucumis palustris]GBF32954.1 helix-turn-helix domain protein [Desulfocucumis palustris]
MDRDEFIQIVSETIKHIRVNRNLTQDRMAEILGISKKTLIQIEKDRIYAGWTVAIACCAIFRNDETLQMVLGGDPLELVDLFSTRNIATPGVKTLGGKIWWRKVDSRGDYVLQNNVISHHFRIIDGENRRWFSSFDEQDARLRLMELAGAGNTNQDNN